MQNFCLDCTKCFVVLWLYDWQLDFQSSQVRILAQTTFFSSFSLFLLENAFQICKNGRFIWKCYKLYSFWNIESNISLKEYYSTMICRLDKKKWTIYLIGVDMPCDQSLKYSLTSQKYEIIIKKLLSVGELNPGLPRDRRGYLPLY